MDERRKDDRLLLLRKVFFLYPHAIIRELYCDIIRHGYDAFLIDDPASIPRLLKKYGASILYINIDEGLKEAEWLAYARSIRKNQATQGTDIGIMTDARLDKKYLSRKYLLDLGVSCGFISLIPDAERLLQVIYKILDANEARGRRRYVRAHCLAGDTFNLMHDATVLRGGLVDISEAGMLCRFEGGAPGLKIDRVLTGIQLVLQSKIALLNGTVYGLRRVSRDELQHLIIFDREHMKPESRENILSYICRRQEDFIKEECTALAAVPSDHPEEEGGPERLGTEANDSMTQELVEDLEIIESGLSEIDQMFIKDSGNAPATDVERKFDIRS
jgi:hypothetical protein